MYFPDKLFLDNIAGSDDIVVQWSIDEFSKRSIYGYPAPPADGGFSMQYAKFFVHAGICYSISLYMSRFLNCHAKFEIKTFNVRMRYDIIGIAEVKPEERKI